MYTILRQNAGQMETIINHAGSDIAYFENFALSNQSDQSQQLLKKTQSRCCLLLTHDFLTH